MSSSVKQKSVRVLSVSDMSGRVVEASKANVHLEKARQAQEEAECLREKLKKDIEYQNSIMKSAAKRKIDKDLRKKREIAANLAVFEILNSSAKVQKKFDDMGPWIVDLVAECVRQVVDDLDADAVVQSVVKKAIATKRKDHQMVLRVGKRAYASAQHLMADLQGTELEGAVAEVLCDPEVADNTIILMTSDGAMDISVPTQIDLLREHLARELLLP